MKTEKQAVSWTVMPGYYENSLENHFLCGDIPVMVHGVGRYPELVNNMGETTRDVPHFVIAYSSITSRDHSGESATTYTSIEVVGKHHRRPDGTRMELTLWEKKIPGTTELAPHIEEARSHLDVATLQSIPTRYAEAEARIAQATDYRDTLTRGDYEAATQELGVRCLADDQCNGWGDFRFPHYDADTVLSHLMADKRWRGRLQDKAERPASPQPAPATPQPDGQLWEPCEYCGKEPVYMPLHVCLDCWPT